MKTTLLILSLLVSHVNGALQFGGNNFTLANATIADQTINMTNQITICFWVKFVDTGTKQKLLAKGRIDFSGQNLYEIQATAADTLAFIYASPDANYHQWTTTNTYVQTTTAFHVAFTFSYGTAASMTCYINGASVAGSWTSGAGNQLGLTNTQAFHLAADSSAGAFYTGQMSEVAIWNTVLDASAVMNLAKGQVFGAPKQYTPSLLKFYFPLNDKPDGTPASVVVTRRDLSGNLNTMDKGGIDQSDRVLSYLPNE